MVAVYLGETDEAKIDNMSYRFFNSILHQLNRKLRYDAAVGYAGNSFFKESNKLIEESNPLAGENEGPNSSYGEQMAALLNSGQIKVVKREKQDKENDDFGIVFGENNSN